MSRLLRFWPFGFIAAVAVFCSLLLTRNVDLRVYWYGVTGFFHGTRPAYGPESGLGFPMEYRYPPVTYLLLSPLYLMPLRVAGFFWMLAAWAAATAAVALAIRKRRLSFSPTAVLVSFAFLASYLLLAVRYGNVQPFVIAFLLAALVLSESRPLCAGALLALAVTFKIWPVLFVPWFLRRSRWHSTFYFAVCFAGLWLAPFAVFGPGRYLQLLHDWFVAVGRVGTTYSEFYYFPGQSLRGLLLRLITPISPPLAFFPDVHVLSLSPRTAVTLWIVIGSAAYLLLITLMLRSDERKMTAWDGAVFVLYSMLEPYAVKSGLISLGPAVLMAAALFSVTTSRSGRRSAAKPIVWANRLFLASCALAFAGALIQYKSLQRWLLSVGLDFWAELLLLAAYLLWIERTTVPDQLRSVEPVVNNAETGSTNYPVVG
ncbi:MAG: DUF2029 domain-containing protein [Acidobacteriota bacterium]|nr:DUF2029 domain-containing protein [Acidobacteriota bacterium]